MSRILLVEDDTMIASGVVYALENEGYEVTHVTNKKDAMQMMVQSKFDIAVLDMQLPDGSGFELGEKLIASETAVIYLTVVDDENTIVKAFDKGASDYIEKPFRIRELLARIRRVLAQRTNPAKSNLLRIGKAIINIDEAKVYVDEKTVELTSLEYRLLLIFANNRGRLLSRNQILENIWDFDGNYVEDNTLTVYIKRLREKMGDAVTIETVRGMGYRVGE